MIQRDVKITNNSGLHARPATFFIQKANTYRSGIWVVKDDRKVSAKSLLGVIYAKKLNWSDIKLICDFDYYHEFEKFIVTGDPVVIEEN